MFLARCPRKIKKRSQDDFQVLCYLIEWMNNFRSEKWWQNGMHWISGHNINNFELRIKSLQRSNCTVWTQRTDGPELGKVELLEPQCGYCGPQEPVVTTAKTSSVPRRGDRSVCVMCMCVCMLMCFHARVCLYVCMCTCMWVWSGMVRRRQQIWSEEAKLEEKQQFPRA